MSYLELKKNLREKLKILTKWLAECNIALTLLNDFRKEIEYPISVLESKVKELERQVNNINKTMDEIRKQGISVQDYSEQKIKE